MSISGLWKMSAVLVAVMHISSVAGIVPHSAPLQHLTLDAPRATAWLTYTSHVPLASKAYVDKNSALAVSAFEALPGAETVSKDLFLQYVLPYANFDEDLDDWREPFSQTLRPLVKSAHTLKEAAEIVVPKVFTDLGAQVQFKSNCTPAILAPVSETLKEGHASCTGLSILVVDALRSVGIPSRVVGTAEWNRPDGGNHNWVEVFTGETWEFFDAAPMTEVQWNTAWFIDLAKQAVPGIHGIYTPVWDASSADSTYTITWRDPDVSLPAIDRTAFYVKLP
jgi:hypothetical protein